MGENQVKRKKKIQSQAQTRKRRASTGLDTTDMIQKELSYHHRLPEESFKKNNKERTERDGKENPTQCTDQGRALFRVSIRTHSSRTHG